MTTVISTANCTTDMGRTGASCKWRNRKWLETTVVTAAAVSTSDAPTWPRRDKRLSSVSSKVFGVARPGTAIPVRRGHSLRRSGLRPGFGAGWHFTVSGKGLLTASAATPRGKAGF